MFTKIPKTPPRNFPLLNSVRLAASFQPITGWSKLPNGEELCSWEGNSNRTYWLSFHPPMNRSICSLFTLQRWPKRWTPGSVNVRRNNCVLLPAANSRTQLFHLIFTEPGVHLLGHPCMRIHLCVWPMSSR